MKTLLWLAAGGGVLYLLDTMGVFGTATVATTTSAASTTSSSPQANNPNATAQNQTLQMVIAKMQQNGLDPVNTYYSASQYNFFYQLVRGIPGPELDQFPANELISINDWWSAMTSNGFSGLGMIALHVNPYLQGPRTSPLKKFGAGLAPTGIETYIFSKGQS